jgi:hypothetical protein
MTFTTLDELELPPAGSRWVVRRKAAVVNAARAGRLSLPATIGLAIAGPSHGAGGPFDGVYAGTRVRTAGPPQTCPTEEEVSIDISGSTLKLTNSFNQTDVEGTGNVYIKGRITGDTIDADVINFPRDCQHHWHLTKQPRNQ